MVCKFFELNATPKSVLNYLNLKYPSIDYYNDYFKLINIIDAHKTEHLTEARLDQLLGCELSPTHLERAKVLRLTIVLMCIGCVYMSNKIIIN